MFIADIIVLISIASMCYTHLALSHAYTLLYTHIYYTLHLYKGTHFDITLVEPSFWSMTELRINIDTNTTSIYIINNTQNVEFPRIHPSWLGRRAQYGYAGMRVCMVYITWYSVV